MSLQRLFARSFDLDRPAQFLGNHLYICLERASPTTERRRPLDFFRRYLTVISIRRQRENERFCQPFGRC